jgi:pSer/pThr/pTyr-binding forkhead associated (FHA) protein
MYPCPKGHNSTEADFCSECGAKIMGVGIAEATVNQPIATSSSATIPCPDCTTPHEANSGNFCEICGYNFLTGNGGGEAFPPQIAPLPTSSTPTNSLPIETAPTPSISTVPAPVKWQVIISIDPSLATPDSPPAPTQAPISIDLTKSTNLIGRTSVARAIHPEISLDFDDAVSSRHAILTLQPDGSSILRDIDSANGTMVNGKDIAALVDVPMRSGDEITLGHWTRIKLIGN